jgi:hypothetical protein
LSVSALPNRELLAIVLRATLSNWHQHWLMVGSRAHGANTVESSRKTRDSSLEITIAVTGIVNTLEKFEDSRVRRTSRIQGVDLLDSDVSVTNDLTTLESLRCGIVGRSGIWSRELVFSVQG